MAVDAEDRSTDGAETFSVEDVPEFWTSLMRASVGATLVIMVCKVLLTVFYGFWSGFEIEMNRVFGVVPQFVFGLGQDRFEHMVRASWVLSCAGAVVWWIMRSIGDHSEGRAITRLNSTETHTEHERQELRFAVFVAEAHRLGGRIGMWGGSLSLLLILAFEHLRKWLIGDIDMPSFPLAALLVALVPVIMLATQIVSARRRPALDADEINELLIAPDERADVEVEA